MDWNGRNISIVNGDDIDPADSYLLNDAWTLTLNGHNPATAAFQGSLLNVTLAAFRCNRETHLCYRAFGDKSDGSLLCLAGTGNNDSPTNATIVIDATVHPASIYTLEVDEPSPALKALVGDMHEDDFIVGFGYSVACVAGVGVFTPNFDFYSLRTRSHH